MPFALLFSALLIGLALGPPASAEPTVRVRVLAGALSERAEVEPLGGAARVLSGGREVGRIGRGERAVVRLRRGGVEVGGAGRHDGPVWIEPEGGATLRVRAGATTRTYRGALEAAADGGALRLVNELPLEAYVASVVADEYPFPELEGVKAQAVLARTFALRHRGHFGAYDVVDGVQSQVYRGVDAETAVSRQAARETAGVILTYGGAPALAVYSSSSGGHTADNEHVWSGAALPYLRGRPDPYDRISPNYRWTSRVPRQKLLDALGKRFGGGVRGFVVAERGREGRVVRVRLLGAREQEVTGNAFRLALTQALGVNALKSTFFEVRVEGGAYVFEGRGFGHGVGMSQFGARGQALEGRSFHDILAFYFSGTALGTLDGAAVEAPAAEAPPSDPLAARRDERAVSADERAAALDRLRRRTPIAPPAAAPAAQTPASEAPVGWSGRPAAARPATGEATAPAPAPRSRVGW